MSDFDLDETRFGFTWGRMVVERIASDPKFGVVVGVWPMSRIEDAVYVRISPKGRTVTIQRPEKLP